MSNGRAKPLQTSGATPCSVAPRRKGPARPQFWAAMSQMSSLATPGSSPPASGRAERSYWWHSSSAATRCQHSRWGRVLELRAGPPLRVSPPAPLLRNLVVELPRSQQDVFSTPGASVRSSATTRSGFLAPLYISSEGCQHHPPTSGTRSWKRPWIYSKAHSSKDRAGHRLKTV